MLILCSENETKDINALSEQNVEFCNVKLGGTYNWGDPKIQGIVKKKLFKVFVQV
jgi:hypothetical protein